MGNWYRSVQAVGALLETQTVEPANSDSGDQSSGGEQADIPERPAALPAASAGPVQSPIPEWMRARLATFPAAGRALPAADRTCLTAQERAAFEEIAAALNAGAAAPGFHPGGLAGNGHRCGEPAALEQEAVVHEATAEPTSRLAGAGQAGGNGAPRVVPSAFFVPDSPSASEIPAGVGKAFAARLREAEGRARELSSVLDAAADGIVILDAEGRVESLNGSAEALFGVRECDAAGRCFTDFLAPGSRPAAARCLHLVKGGGNAGPTDQRCELDGQAGSGPVPLLVTFGKIGGDRIGRFCAILRNLTHWKRAEADLVAARCEAEQASSQKSDLLARVSHEIRTPLNGIIGFADVILGDGVGCVDNERYREYVRDIRTSGEHVLSLVNDLLDIAKIEAGKLELNFTPVQLNELARECMMLMQPAAGVAKIILRSSLSGNLPPVRADARSVRQVILNLLSNSAKFTPPGGQVILSTGAAPDGAVVLRVRDTGCGMTDADLVRALEPFRQVATDARSDRFGTGLGLPLTKALVEANRGTFAITSAKGEGTIVKIAFPPCGETGPS